jgi:hypothetical protein
MSGSSGANLPVRIGVEGLPEAERAFNQVAQAGDRAMQAVERATGNASATTERLRTALTTIGGSVGGGELARATQAIDGFLGSMQSAAAGAEALAARGITLSRVLVGIGGLVGLPVLLQSVGLGINSAGTAAQGATQTMQNWEAALQRLDPVLAAVAAKARDTGAALRSVQMGQLELQFAAVMERRTTALTAIQSLDGQIAQAQAAVAAAQAREQEAAEPGRTTPLMQRGLAVQTERAQAELQRLRDTRRQYFDEWTQMNAQMSRFETARNNIEQVVGREIPVNKPERPAAAAGPARRELDVNESVGRSIDDLTRRWEEYQRTAAQASNLAAAGIERAQPALDRYAQTMDLLQRLLDARIVTEEQFTEEVRKQTEALGDQIEAAKDRGRELDDVGRRLGLTFTSAFEDALTRGRKLREVLAGIANDIAKLLIRKTITEPAAKAIEDILKGVTGGGGGGGDPKTGGGTGGGGSLLGSAVSWLGSLLGFGGARAEGGPVTPGRWYMVGERGPEPFIPTTPGMILPAGSMQAAMQPQAPAPTITVAIDARGAGPREIDILRAQIGPLAQAAVMNAMARSLDYKKAIRGG